jgi:hypothetical protein
MSDYGHYVTYRHDTDRIRDQVEMTQRSGGRARSRHLARRALARRLHTLADRLDG